MLLLLAHGHLLAEFLLFLLLGRVEKWRLLKGRVHGLKCIAILLLLRLHLVTIADRWRGATSTLTAVHGVLHAWNR